MDLKELVNQPHEHQDGRGTLLTLCVIDELSPKINHSVQAIAIIGGMSVCRNHLPIVLKGLSKGWSIESLCRDLIEGRFN